MSKGSHYRPCNKKLYDENYDRIFRSVKIDLKIDDRDEVVIKDNDGDDETPELEIIGGDNVKHSHG